MPVSFMSAVLLGIKVILLWCLIVGQRALGDCYLGCGRANSHSGGFGPRKDIHFLKKLVLSSLKLLELGAGVIKGNLYIL